LPGPRVRALDLPVVSPEIVGHRPDRASQSSGGTRAAVRSRAVATQRFMNCRPRRFPSQFQGVHDPQQAARRGSGSPRS
jgi:hypothetical protein